MNKNPSPIFLDGKPWQMKRPTPRVESIIKLLDKLPAHEFLSIPEIASRLGRTIPSVTIACQVGAEWLKDYQIVSTNLGVWRKKVLGSKAGIKRLRAELKSNEAQ